MKKIAKSSSALHRTFMRNCSQCCLPPNISLHFVENATHEAMKYADLAIVTSGTATLETACFETPMIVVYRTSWLTYLIARALVRVKNIGLVNIVAGKTIVPELIQYNVTVQKIVELASGLLKNEAQRTAMKKDLSARERFARLKRSIGKCCRCNSCNESGVMDNRSGRW